VRGCTIIFLRGTERKHCAVTLVSSLSSRQSLLNYFFEILTPMVSGVISVKNHLGHGQIARLKPARPKFETNFY